jgi:hypothetical protein
MRVRDGSSVRLGTPGPGLVARPALARDGFRSAPNPIFRRSQVRERGRASAAVAAFSEPAIVPKAPTVKTTGYNSQPMLASMNARRLW